MLLPLEPAWRDDSLALDLYPIGGPLVLLIVLSTRLPTSSLNRRNWNVLPSNSKAFKNHSDQRTTRRNCSFKGKAASARRARCALLWADGERRLDTRNKLACDDEFASRWAYAYVAQGLTRLVRMNPSAIHCSLQVNRSQLRNSHATLFMEIRLLRYFIAVAEELHFARAAEKLGIVQSPLSRAIRDLEDELGLQLFKRTSRNTQLTRAGEVFLNESRRVLATVEDAVAFAQSTARGYNGYLRIGICDSHAHPRIASLLARCRTEQPEVSIRIFEMPFAQQVRGIQNGLLDGGIAFSNKVGSELSSEAIWVEPLSVVTPVAHPLLRHARVQLKDALHYPLVLCHPDAGSGCHDQIMSMLRDTDSPFQVVEQATSLGLMLTLVSAGYGIGFSIASHVQALRHTELGIRPFAGAAPTMTTYLLRPAGAATEPMASFTRRAREQMGGDLARDVPTS